MITVVGMPMQYDSKLYNCAAVTYHGKVLGYVPKQYLPNYNEFYEMRHFTAWDGSKCEYFLNRFDTDADGECDDSLSAYFGAGLIFCCNNMHDFLSESSCAKICGRPALPRHILHRKAQISFLIFPQATR